jgi:hypothetical protein
MRLRVRGQSAELPFDQEYVPGLGIVRKLDNRQRWQLAGEYAATHRLVGPWFRRVCALCTTKGRCEYGRWSDDVLIAEVRREWLGC